MQIIAIQCFYRFSFLVLLSLVLHSCGIQYKDIDESSDLTWRDEASADGVPLDDASDAGTMQDGGEAKILAPLAENGELIVLGEGAAQDTPLMKSYLKKLGVDQNYHLIRPLLDSVDLPYAGREPVMRDGRFQWVAVVESEVLKLTQDPQGLIAKRRNSVIDEVLNNSSHDLKYLVAAGGVAKESLGTYIMARGGNCQNAYSNLEGFRRVLTSSVLMSDLRHFYYPIDEDQHNLLLKEDEMDSRGRALTFSWGSLSGVKIDFDEQAHRAELQRRLTLAGLNADTGLSKQQKIAYRNFRAQLLSRIIYLEGGLANSGFEDARQLGINFKTCSLDEEESPRGKGLQFFAIKQPR